MAYDSDKFTLGEDAQGGVRYKAEDAYKDYEADGVKQGVMQQAEVIAEMTIPAAFPPLGWKPGDRLPSNNQSMGTKAVNSLASALMFMAFPPGQPIFKWQVATYKIRDEIKQDPEFYANTVLALAELEITHRERFQATPLATAYVGYIKQLIIAGNALWKHLKLDEPTYSTMRNYVVKRDFPGNPLVIIHKRCVTLDQLDGDHREQVWEVLSDAKKYEKGKLKRDWEIEVEVYDCQRRWVADDGEVTWCYWEETHGITLEETEVEADADNPPMWAGWLIPSYGNNWGISYCYEYIGDLFITETNASALNDGASLAALALLFAKPGGPSIKAIREARNLSVLPGSAEELSVFRSEKQGDFSFVLEWFQLAQQRLESAFLMQESIQRNAERVTAEEIKRLGAALDKAMGGLYTEIGQGNQRVIITRAVNLHEEEEKDLPKPPREFASIRVITGIDALGNSTDYDNLMEYGQAAMTIFPQSFEAYHNPGAFFTRLAASKAVRPDGLIKSTGEVQQAQAQAKQEQMQQTLLEKGTTPAVKGIADALQQQGGNPLSGDPSAAGGQPQQPPQ
jgi:hypothetical protein